MATHESTLPSESPVPDAVKAHPTWFRLIDQRNWYDTKSQHCKRWYKRLKTAQISLAVLVPAESLLSSGSAKVVSSLCGVLIAVLGTYRAAVERLNRQQYLFLSAAGPYKGMAHGDRLVALAERVEEHVATEYANWVSDTRRSAFGQKPEGQ